MSTEGNTDQKRYLFNKQPRKGVKRRRRPFIAATLGERVEFFTRYAVTGRQADTLTICSSCRHISLSIPHIANCFRMEESSSTAAVVEYSTRTGISSY